MPSFDPFFDFDQFSETTTTLFQSKVVIDPDIISMDPLTIMREMTI